MRGARASGGVSDGAMLALIGGAVALAAAVWAWGGLAGLLFGGGWPRVGAGQLPGVLVRLPARLAHPAAAWPRGARALLPGAGGFYAALTVLAASLGALVGAAARAGLLSRLGRPSAGARWAGAGELRALHGRARTGRLALGRCRGRLLYAEQRHALVAPSGRRSRASRRGWPSPRCSSGTGRRSPPRSRPTCWRARWRAGRRWGRCSSLTRSSSRERRRQTWSPLRGASSWDGALEVAWRLAAAGELDQRGVEGGDFWAIAAEQRLAPLLFAAARTGAGMAAVVRWAYGQGSRELYEAISAAHRIRARRGRARGRARRV